MISYFGTKIVFEKQYQLQYVLQVDERLIGANERSNIRDIISENQCQILKILEVNAKLRDLSYMLWIDI